MNFEDWVDLEEGKRYRVYDDATGKEIVPGTHVMGHPTIGSGRALDVNGISERERITLRDSDIATATSRCVNIFGEAYFTLDFQRQNALRMMSFQLGEKLREFVKLRDAVKREAWDEAADAALDSRWALETPARAKRVTDLLRSGVWPTT